MPDLRGFLAAHGLGRAVVVQPSVYGADNRCTLDAVAALGEDARAVLVLDPEVDDAALAALHARGARGVRLNLHTGGPSGATDDPAAALALVRGFAGRLRGSGWHLQVFGNHAVVAGLEPVLPGLGLPLVIDHLGLVGRGAVPLAEAARTVLRLVAEVGAHVKLSAPHRAVPDPDQAPELAWLVRGLAAAAPERLVWGSDWPHTSSRRSAGPDGVEPFEAVDDRAALRRLAGWLDDAAALRRVLVDNPAALYGWAAAQPPVAKPG